MPETPEVAPKKILVADDDQHIRQIVKLFLIKEKYEVIEAKDGKEAYLKAKQEKTRCHLS